MPQHKSNKEQNNKKGTCHKSSSRPKKSQLRIIGGQFRGRKLTFESAQGLRPTLDQVRETLFNWLSADIHGAKCLDLFSGSGALGFEALSRGALSVTFVDNNNNAINHIKSNLEMLASNLNQTSGMSEKNNHCINQTSEEFLKSTNEQFDYVFLDPPYELGFIQPTLESLQSILNPNAIIYIEMEANLPLEFLDNSWEIKKMKSSSKLVYGLIKQK